MTETKATVTAGELAAALVMFDDKVRDIQDFCGDPSSYVHNALQTAQLVHGDTIAKARALLASLQPPTDRGETDR